MTGAFTLPELVRALVRSGLSEERAEAEARRQHGIQSALPEQRETAQEIPDILWPVRLTIPWSLLVSDNDKDRAIIRNTKHGPRPAKAITPDYAAAKLKIAALGKRAVGDALAVAMPLALHGTVFVPDDRPHDMSNRCKLLHDALEGVVYRNDRWLHELHYLRAVDVDAPRAELTIRPLPAP